MTLTAEEVLELVPQKPPFRFLDRLLSLDETTAVGEYTFRPDEWFYAGHFPGHPVTPGVILLETMCQTGLVAMGIYLLGLEAPRDQVAKTVTLFTDSQVEFERVVPPGATVRVQAERIFWRRQKLRSSVRLTHDGNLVASGVVSGMGVSRDQQ
jgi:3-hydroxyacyl-[acyl-carrier-protein] dehydratase